MRGSNKLTQAQIKGLRPESGKARRLSDGGGLYIEATPAGSLIWRMAYRYAGLQKTLTFGPHPAVTIQQARALRDEAKAHLVWGRDPGEVKKAAKAAKKDSERTFGAVADRWIQYRKDEGKADKTLAKDNWMVRNLKESLGKKEMADIKPRDIVEALAPYVAAGNLQKVDDFRVRLSMIYRYANAILDMPCGDPAATAKDAIPRPRESHYASIRNSAEFGAYLRKLDTYGGSFSTRMLLRMAPHIFLRSTEIRTLMWKDYDEQDALIKIDAERMKMKREHWVPVSPQVAKILADMRAARVNEFIFPGSFGRDPYLSSGTLTGALKRLGYDGGRVTFHGFRSTANTMLAEANFPNEVIEIQMSHSKKGVSKSYNYAAYLDQRREMMEYWSDQVEWMKNAKYT